MYNSSHCKSTIRQLKKKKTLQKLRNRFLQPRNRKQPIHVQIPFVWGTQHTGHREELQTGRPHLSPRGFTESARRSLEKPMTFPFWTQTLILTCGRILSTKQCSGSFSTQNTCVQTLAVPLTISKPFYPSVPQFLHT